MIVISSEYLDRNWASLNSDAQLPTTFSEWDDGDAYTLAEIGKLPSKTIVEGLITLQENVTESYPIIIQLKPLKEADTPGDYQSPDGVAYEVIGKQKKNGDFVTSDVRIESIDENIGHRRRGILETNLLKDKTILVIGLGTGGITVAQELAKAGVGGFVLIDHDRLEVGNLARHSAGISFVGRRKVAAAKDLIQEIDPNIHVEIHTVKADTDHQTLVRNAVEQSDLVICATDNRPSKLFINTICVNLNKTVLFGGAFRRAYGGQVVRVKPHQSACFQCFVLSMPEDEADREISSQEDADAIAYSDMPVAVEPGLSMDVAPIALMVSKLALQELIIGKESTLHMLDEDFEANWYLWINRPEPNTQYASLPPLSHSADEQWTILRWYGVELSRVDHCPTCGDFEAGMREQYQLDSEPESLPTLPKQTQS